MHNILTKLLPVGAMLLLGSMSLAAQTLYVDGSLQQACEANTYSQANRSCSGSDGAGYQTIPEAVSNMQPGDVVVVRGGVYQTPVVLNKSGTPEAHLRIAAFPGEQAVIDTGGSSGVDGIQISSQAYIDIAGLIIRNGQKYGIEASNSSYLTISDCEVAFSTNGGIISTNSSNVSIDGCNVHHNNLNGLSSMMEAVSLQAVTQFQVANCRVHDNLKEGIDVKYGTSYGSISNNDAYRNNGANIYLDGVSFISVFNNLAHDAVSPYKAGIGLAVESTYNTVQASSHDLTVYNNVIYGNGAGISFWLEDPSKSWSHFSNIGIVYNTISDNNLTNWGGIYLINGTLANFGSGNTIRDNLFWNNTNNSGAKSIRDDAGVVGSFAVDHNFYQAGAPSASYGSSAVMPSVNPFIDEGIANYHLQSGSAARGAGIPTDGITVDLDGKPRPSSNTDIGAYQY